MFRKLLIAASAVSAVLAIAVLYCLCAIPFGSPDVVLAILEDLHVAITRGMDNANSAEIAFYRNPEGPYCGGIIAFSGDAGRVNPWPQKRGFGPAWGIYFRSFRWINGHELWTLSVSLWYPLILFALLPIALLQNQRRARRPLRDRERTATA